MVLRDADDHGQRHRQRLALGRNGREQARRPGLAVAARLSRDRHRRGVRREPGRHSAADADHGDKRRRRAATDGAGDGLLLFGLGGNDTLSGSSTVDGLDGGSGKDKVTGGGGADDLYGESGRDRLMGGADDDYLDGGKGRDKLSGGDDADILHGGNGADRFILAKVTQSTPDAPDTILDFTSGKDQIDLSQIDARPDAKGNNAFVFIGDRPFHGRAGELRYEFSGGDTVVQGDTDGDGIADLAIVLTGKLALTVSDFLL